MTFQSKSNLFRRTLSCNLPVFFFFFFARLMTGILLYRVMRNERKKKMDLIHGAIMISALLLAAVGLKAVFDFHDLAQPEPHLHFTSLHSWIGLITICFLALQVYDTCLSQHNNVFTRTFGL